MHMREPESVQEVCRRKDRDTELRRIVIRKIGLIFCLILVAVPAAFISKVPSAYAACTLQNPIVSPGQDPSIWYANGLYYLVQSENGGIWLRAAPTLGGLATGQHQQIWAPPTGTSYSQEIWGPEIEDLNRQWIIYFAADDGNNNNHRIYAITANSNDPMGSWSFFGKVEDSTNEWAIDPTVFYYNSNWYELWSGTPPGNGGAAPQQIYIAHMS